MLRLLQHVINADFGIAEQKIMIVSFSEAILLAACVAALVSTSHAAYATSCTTWGEKSAECQQTCGPVAGPKGRNGCYYYGDASSTAGLYCTFGTVTGWSFACPPNLPAGSRVTRGTDWVWSTQDGGEGKLGTTAGVVDADGWVQVCGFFFCTCVCFVKLLFRHGRFLKKKIGFGEYVVLF
jgi:hypothetical protein